MVSSSVICEVEDSMLDYPSNGHNKTSLCTHLLFYHAKLLINRLEMEAEKSGPIEKIFEVPQGDISDLLRN